MIRAKKALGQHFLIHPRIAERIVHVAPLTNETPVFEIGPGTGILTAALLARVKKVVALEADVELCERLKERFREEIAARRLTLYHGDVRTFDPAVLPRGYTVVANIPYYLTGTIVRTFLTAANQPASMTLLVQKEVGERIARAKKQSLLSLSVQAYGTPTYAFAVPRGAFKPAPKVDSAVIVVRDISRKNFPDRSMERRFFELIRAGFAHKRKLARNNLAETGCNIESIPTRARAEDIPFSTWLSLSRSQRNAV